MPSCGLINLHAVGFPPSDHSAESRNSEAGPLRFDILAVGEAKTIPGILPRSFTASDFCLIVRIRITNASDFTQSFYSTDILVKLDDIEYKHLAMESYWYGKARAVPNVK